MATITRQGRGNGGNGRTKHGGRKGRLPTPWSSRAAGARTEVGAATPPLSLDAFPRRRHLDIRSPLTGEMLGTVPVMNHVQVLEAVERARSVQRGWVDLQGEERFDYLK